MIQPFDPNQNLEKYNYGPVPKSPSQATSSPNLVLEMTGYLQEEEKHSKCDLATRRIHNLDFDFRNRSSIPKGRYLACIPLGFFPYIYVAWKRYTTAKKAEELVVSTSDEIENLTAAIGACHVSIKWRYLIKRAQLYIFKNEPKLALQDLLEAKNYAPFLESYKIICEMIAYCYKITGELIKAFKYYKDLSELNISQETKIFCKMQLEALASEILENKKISAKDIKVLLKTPYAKLKIEHYKILWDELTDEFHTVGYEYLCAVRDIAKEKDDINIYWEAFEFLNEARKKDDNAFWPQKEITDILLKECLKKVESKTHDSFVLTILGTLYFYNNPPVESDVAEDKRKDLGLNYMILAAEKGSIFSLYALGRAYHHINKSTEAIHYFQEAAKQEHAESLFYLGKYHEEGLGTAKDSKKALEFYNKAQEKGYECPYSIKRLKEITLLDDLILEKSSSTSTDDTQNKS